MPLRKGPAPPDPVSDLAARRRAEKAQPAPEAEKPKRRTRKPDDEANK